MDSDAFKTKAVSMHTQKWLDELDPAKGVDQRSKADGAEKAKPKRDTKLATSPDEVS